MSNTVAAEVVLGPIVEIRGYVTDGDRLLADVLLADGTVVERLDTAKVRCPAARRAHAA